MLGKQVKFETLTFAQRAAIRKLERVNGWDAVTITEKPAKGHDYDTINVIFDTGPRRMDFASVMLDGAGWSVTTGGDDCKRILNDEEFQLANFEEWQRIERKRLGLAA